MVSEQQEAILEKAVEKDFITFNDALDFYVYEEAVSRSLKTLVEKGLLYYEFAPDRCREMKVWFPTEKCYFEYD